MPINSFQGCWNANNDAIPFHLVGIIPPLFWLLLPRILVLYLIYVDQGLTLWFLLHLLVGLMVWGGGGHQMTRSRRRDY